MRIVRLWVIVALWLGSICLLHGFSLSSSSLTARRRGGLAPSRVGHSKTRCLDAISQSESEREKGIAVLVTVPLAWGTFEPVVRYVYSSSSTTTDLPSLPGFIFSTAYYLVAASVLWSALVLIRLIGRMRTASEATDPDSDTESVENDVDESQTSALSARGGFELGFYLFLGNAMQVIGLKTVPADRAAFLLQLTVLFVPLAEAILFSKTLSNTIWNACAIAMTGVAILSLDGENESQSFSLAFSSGDVWIVGAAAAYTFHCIRLEEYAQRIPSAVQLAASKATAETILSALATLALASCAIGIPQEQAMNFFQSTGKEIVEYTSKFLSVVQSGTLFLQDVAPSLVAILWTGCVTVAYTIYAQSYGQRRVEPSVANLIYTIQPVFTALLAWVVLGEKLGPLGYVGGALICSSVLLITGPNLGEK